MALNESLRASNEFSHPRYQIIITILRADPDNDERTIVISMRQNKIDKKPPETEHHIYCETTWLCTCSELSQCSLSF